MTGVFEPLELSVTEFTDTSISLVWGVYIDQANLPDLTNYELTVTPEHAVPLVSNLIYYLAFKIKFHKIEGSYGYGKNIGITIRNRNIFFF